MPPTSISPHAFREISEFVRVKSGIVIESNREYLVTSRLKPVCSQFSLSSFEALAECLASRPDPALCTAVVEALTTNETSFFRDRTPFQSLSNTIVPRLLSAPHRGSNPLRIWCAAASTGQEPYSVAMTLAECRYHAAKVPFTILATDISTEVLEKGKSRLYTQFEIQRGMPIRQLTRHFSQTGTLWRINANIAETIEWQPLNLVEDVGAIGKFDIIFCRNVLIYFDDPTKREVLERLRNCLVSDGILVLGAAESVIGYDATFDAVGEDARGFYRLASPAKGHIQSPSLCAAI